MDTFQNRLNYAIAHREISAADLAKISGISEAAISNYKSGKYKATQRNLEKLSNALNVSIPWLMGADVPMERTTHSQPRMDIDFSSIKNIQPMPEMKKIPLLGRIACGEPILADDNIEDYINVSKEMNADFSLQCRGESMIGARLHDGDIVYIRSQSDVDNGEIAAVLIDDEATLKRVYKYSDRIVLQPENPAFSPMVFVGEETANVRILGKAIAFTSVIKN